MPDRITFKAELIDWELIPSMEILYMARRDMLGYEITRPVATIIDEDPNA